MDFDSAHRRCATVFSSVEEAAPSSLRFSGFRQSAHAALTPPERLKLLSYIDPSVSRGYLVKSLSPAKGISLVSSSSSKVPGTAVLAEPTQTGVRRWERFTVDIRLKASFKRNGMPLAIFGRGSDVSEGGMAAYIPSELAVGTSVDLELSLPYVSGEQPIRISAVVRNRNGFRYGLEYLSLSGPDKERLLKSLKALSLTR